MSDFGDLRRIREVKKAQIQKMLEDEGRRAEATQLIENRKRSNVERLNGTVMGVL